MRFDSNYVCKLTWIKGINQKIIEESQFLNTHSRIPIFEEISLSMLIRKFIVFGLMTTVSFNLVSVTRTRWSRFLLIYCQCVPWTFFYHLVPAESTTCTRTDLCQIWKPYSTSSFWIFLFLGNREHTTLTWAELEWF